MKQAPILKFNGNKERGEANFYKLPQECADIVFNVLGNASAQLRVMIVLIGTKPGFGVSQEWLLKRTGLSERTYISARKELVKRGWIKHIDGEEITVDFDKIYSDKPLPEMVSGDEKKSKPLPEMVSGEKPEMVSGVIPEMVSVIIDKQRDRETNKQAVAQGATASRKEITEAEFAQMEIGNNRLIWDNAEKGELHVDGVAYRVKWTNGAPDWVCF